MSMKRLFTGMMILLPACGWTVTLTGLTTGADLAYTNTASSGSTPDGGTAKELTISALPALGDVAQQVISTLGSQYPTYTASASASAAAGTVNVTEYQLFDGYYRNGNPPVGSDKDYVSQYISATYSGNTTLVWIQMAVLTTPSGSTSTIDFPPGSTGPVYSTSNSLFTDNPFKPKPSIRRLPHQHLILTLGHLLTIPFWRACLAQI